MRVLFSFLLFFIISFTSCASQQQSNDSLIFDDFPLKEDLHLPDWFSLSFLDLNDSLKEALKDGKKGIILYFGRKDCPYCKSLLEVNWGDPAIIKFTQKHFNVIAINVRGDRVVTDFDGKTWSEKDYAALRRTNFTPSLLFYNGRAQLVLKLPGYRPKYQFRAALEYVADAHYQHESFRKYLSRAESALGFGSEELNENDIFIEPPYNLDRSKPLYANQKPKPLVVFFEHPRCHACDVLHGDTLNSPEVNLQLHQLDVVQLNTFKDTPVITPDGKHTTAKKWASDLNLTFAPSLIFFDETGKEILRVESVIRFYRLNNVLRYVIGKEYLKYPTFQNWLHDTSTQLKK